MQKNIKGPAWRLWLWRLEERRGIDYGVLLSHECDRGG